MSESSPLPRLAARRLTRLKDVMPVVVLMGAGQTGKSTLIGALDGEGTRSYLISGG